MILVWLLGVMSLIRSVSHMRDRPANLPGFNHRIAYHWD